jgi:hypothetical protein
MIGEAEGLPDPEGMRDFLHSRMRRSHPGAATTSIAAPDPLEGVDKRSGYPRLHPCATPAIPRLGTGGEGDHAPNSLR